VSGPRILPATPARPVHAAALVLHHTKPVPLEPMFRQLDAHPEQRGIASVRLAPITVCDFYARTNALPDLCAMDREGNAEGHPRAGDVPVRAWSEVGVPAAACDVSAVHPGAAGRGGCAAEVEGAR
jgi:hypothetical protein